MVAKTVLADLMSVIEFSPPAFALADRTIAVLRAIHDHTTPHYMIDLADMRVSGGQAVSDLVVDVTMLGGNAAVRVSVQDMTSTFRQIKTDQDVDICARIMSASEQAIADTLPNITIPNRLLACTLSMNLGHGDANARDHVARLVKFDRRLASSDFCGSVCQPLINLEAVNREADWRAMFLAAPHREHKSYLFVRCSVEYGSNNPSTASVGHIEQVANEFLTAIDLEVDSLWNTVG